MTVDICFISSPLNWSANHPPYHYIYLGAFLEKNGISYEIVDEKLEYPTVNRIFAKLSGAENLKPESIITKKTLDHLKVLKPKAIGMAVYSSDYNYMMKLASLIKNEIGCYIVVGNAHASIIPEDFIYKGSDIDFAVMGEGEATLLDLLTALKNNASVEKIPGLMFLKDGIPFTTEKRALLSDLSADLRPAYKRIPMRYYTRPTTSIIRHILLKGAGVYTGRGCPFACKFCAANVIWSVHGEKKFVRFRPLETVIEEIAFLRDTYNIDGFSINDDTFTYKKERVYDFCERLKKTKLDLIWTAQGRVNLINKDMLRAMKDAGCVQIEFGIESASPKCLKEVDKGTRPEEQYKAFEICNDVGVRTFANMLINIPGETENDVEISETFLKVTKPSEVAFSVTTPYPGTAIYEKYVNPKLTRDEYDMLFSSRQFGGDRFKLAQHNLDLETLSRRLLKRHRYGNKLPFMSLYFESIYLRKLFRHMYEYSMSFIGLAIKYFAEKTWFYLRRI